jgi:hypothetical protein
MPQQHNDAWSHPATTMPPEESLRRRHRPMDERGSVSNDVDGLEGFDHQSLSSSSSDNDDLLFVNPETAEHRRSTLKNNPMSGMTFPRLCRLLLIEKIHSIDWWRYKNRILCLFGVSLFNSFLSTMEWIYIKCCLQHVFQHVQQDEQPPLFVLGHPRTGTTLLHSLLAQDESRFTTCSTFCAGFPDSFLTFESVGKILFQSMLSPTRPMDNMRLYFDLPQEDELATCLLTGGRSSPYLSLYFMRDEQEYRPFQTFRGITDSVHVHRWTQAFQWLCTKLKVRNVLQQMSQSTTFPNLPTPKRLLLKSPCHTGRIRLLLKLYPNAQFVYVHRHPLEVFLSSVHMANTTYGYMFLQQPGDLREFILKQGELLIEEYVSCVQELDELQLGKNLVEVSFEDLTSNPYKVIQSVYNGLEGMETVFAGDKSPQSYPAKLEEYCKSLRGYRKNQFDTSKLDDELMKEIQSRWKVQFEHYGYSQELK